MTGRAGRWGPRRDWLTSCHQGRGFSQYPSKGLWTSTKSPHFLKGEYEDSHSLTSFSPLMVVMASPVLVPHAGQQSWDSEDHLG